MASTYENIAYDRVLKGVEIILETEFKGEALIYLSPEYEEYPKSKSVRLWNLPSDETVRRTASVVEEYPIEITCYSPIGQRSTRVINNEVTNLSARVRRVLLDNTPYRVSGVYKWHQGIVDTDYSPDRVEGEEITNEPGPKVMSINRLLFTVTVEEVF